jgi:hypothetical protein
MPKSAIQKKAATTSKKWIGPWFQHPDTFYIYIWSKYTNNAWNICHIGGVVGQEE